MIPKVDWRPPRIADLPSWADAKRVCIDVETKDPDLNRLGPGDFRPGNHVVGIAFSIEDGATHYLPIRHEGGDNLNVEHVLEYVRDQCRIYTGSVVGANLGYDMGFLAQRCLDAGVDYLVLKPYSQATFMLSHTYENIDYTDMREFLQGVTQMSTKTFKVIYRHNAITNEITKTHGFDKCRSTPTAWVYSMADGRVFTCSAHLLDDKFCIGNLNDNTFQEIWEGERRRENWEMMREFDIKKCRLSCRMAGPNKSLQELTQAKHINFI